LLCKQASDGLILDIIEIHAWKYLSDKNIRASVYSYLKNIQQQTKQGLLPMIKRLKIVPVKALDDGQPVFISYSEKQIWYGDSEKSTESYSILFTEWLTADDFNKVFDLTSNANTNIKEMNNAQRRTEYERKLNQFFNGSDAEEKYKWLVNEFKTNKQEMQQSQGWFLQNKDSIPLRTTTGGYRCAKRTFAASSSSIYLHIKGNALKHLLVDESDYSIAQFLQCDHISRVGFEDIKDTLDEGVELTQEDIEDLQNRDIVPYGIMILAQCKDGGYISDALIAQNPWIGGLGGDKVNEDGFPTRPVTNLEHLNERIVRLWQDEPIKVVSKEVTRTESVGKTVDGKEVSIVGGVTNQYAKQMYSAKSDIGICFCQLCKKPYQQKYIEVNKVEYLPDFYWEQLKLCLCLNCSKDFEMLRNKPSIGEAFVESIKSNDVEIEADGTIMVRIGDKKIAFTATHFAEAQQILRVM
jgi:hypothetical protein